MIAKLYWTIPCGHKRSTDKCSQDTQTAKLGRNVVFVEDQGHGILKLDVVVNDQFHLIGDVRGGAEGDVSLRIGLLEKILVWGTHCSAIGLFCSPLRLIVTRSFQVYSASARSFLTLTRFIYATCSCNSALPTSMLNAH